jgi:hypothetical protein
MGRVKKNEHVVISEDELIDHVTSQYIKGKDGPLEESPVDAHALYLKRLRGHPVLVLNADYQVRLRIADTPLVGSCSKKERIAFTENCFTFFVLYTRYCTQPISLLPLSVWSWQDAIKSIFSGKVTVVDVYPGVIIRAVTLEVPLPSVIALNEYMPANKQRPAFTRRNVFLRDQYKCQYCSDRFHTSSLTLDHVVPKSRGGALTW